MRNYILVLAALFFSSVAKAESYLIYQFSENTRVVINNQSCLVKGLSGSRAAVQFSNGQHIKGCWKYVDGGKHVRIDWDNPAKPGDFAVLRLNDFYSVTDQQ